MGNCDVPAVRDSWVPHAQTPIVTVCIHFNVFANDNGTSLAATQTQVDAQVAQLNADFLPSGIQFEQTTSFINDTTYRSMADAEEFAMKSAYVDGPAQRLNVYVVNIESGYLGWGTFPWDPAATGTEGGIVIDDDGFGVGQKTLTHEVGHCVGLWHTHRGVDEVAACSACYEPAGGVNGDTTGDFASDTDPTPTNFNCPPPGGSDACSGAAWGPTDTQNYMGYAPDFCYTEFSPHQFGRMHCWFQAQLSGWLCETTGACCVGQACSIETAAACAVANGAYLGDTITCDSLTGAPIIYSAVVNSAIPDGGGAQNPLTHTITVPDTLAVGDVDVDIDITQTWVGDLTFLLSHGDTTVTLANRPGVPGSTFGCDAQNYHITLDDEGSGGSIEVQCVTDLASPPNYLPDNALGAFDGMDASGDWIITVYDSVAPDPGTLNDWALRITEQGPSPCAPECLLPSDCDDGVFCNGEEYCEGGVCMNAAAPCGVMQACHESEALCLESSIPTVSQWGVAVMMLLVLTTATLLFRRIPGA